MFFKNTGSCFYLILLRILLCVFKPVVYNTVNNMLRTEVYVVMQDVYNSRG